MPRRLYARLLFHYARYRARDEHANKGTKRASQKATFKKKSEASMKVNTPVCGGERIQ